MARATAWGEFSELLEVLERIFVAADAVLQRRQGELRGVFAVADDEVSWRTLRVALPGEAPIEIPALALVSTHQYAVAEMIVDWPVELVEVFLGAPRDRSLGGPRRRGIRRCPAAAPSAALRLRFTRDRQRHRHTEVSLNGVALLTRPLTVGPGSPAQRRLPRGSIFLFEAALDDAVDQALRVPPPPRAPVEPVEPVEPAAPTEPPVSAEAPEAPELTEPEPETETETETEPETPTVPPLRTRRMRWAKRRRRSARRSKN